MTSIYTKKAHNYLQAEHGDLGAVLKKIRALNELNTKVFAYLDEHTKKYCQVANLTASTLTLIAANGSIATQLRFLMPDLLRKFKSDPILRKIQTIECKVRPPQSQPTSRKSMNNHPMKKLSPEAAESIREIAKSIDDETLREAMERIAKNT